MKNKWAIVNYYETNRKPTGYIWSVHNSYEAAVRASRKHNNGMVGLKEVKPTTRAKSIYNSLEQIFGSAEGK